MLAAVATYGLIVLVLLIVGLGIVRALRSDLHQRR
jgi:hypothetical protein